MLGLSASIPSEQSYAEAERYRERFYTPSGAYFPMTNPLGNRGPENILTYIGDFSRSSDDDNFIANDANISIDGNALKIDATDDLGSGYIGVKTVPGVTYKVTYDITGLSLGNNGKLLIGHAGDDDAFANSGYITAGSHTLSFTPTLTHYAILKFYSRYDTKFAKYDNISLKEA